MVFRKVTAVQFYFRSIFLLAALYVMQHYRDDLTRGPFLESPGNLTGPKSNSQIKVSKVSCVLASNEVHFVSLADNLTVQFSNLLKLSSGMKYKTA